MTYERCNLKTTGIKCNESNSARKRNDGSNAMNVAASPRVPAYKDYFNFEEEDIFYDALDTHVPEANNKEIIQTRTNDDWLSDDIKRTGVEARRISKATRRGCQA